MFASLATAAARSQIIRGRDAGEKSIGLESVFCERIFAIRQSISRLGETRPPWWASPGARDSQIRFSKQRDYAVQNGRNFSAMAGGIGIGVSGPPVVESRQQTAVIRPSATSSSAWRMSNS